MDPKELAGPVKVAILIQAMDRGRADEFLGRMNPEERELIRGLVSQMGSISPELVERVAREFAEKMESNKRPVQAPRKEIEENADEAAKTDDASAASSGLETLQAMEPEQLAEILKEEHPQTIAVILVHLSSEKASQVLGKMPEDAMVEVALRIAALDKVNSRMVEEIDRFFAETLENKKASVSKKTGGVDRLAEILNQSEEMSGQVILNEIEEIDPELASRIKQKMFVFEDITLVDNQGLQKVLRKVERSELAMALKGASDEAKEKVFRNMSERAAEMLKEEMDTLGAVRMKEVEDAQQSITNIMQDMEAKGELIISGRRGEEIIA